MKATEQYYPVVLFFINVLSNFLFRNVNERGRGSWGNYPPTLPLS